MTGLEKAIKNIIKYKYSSNQSNFTHICYGIDDNYARCMATSIASFCINNKNRNFCFNVVAADLSNKTQNSLSVLANRFKINIYIYEIDKKFFSKMPIVHDISIATYFRILLPTILNTVSTIFYIDADIICLKNANQLFDLKIGNNIIAAVPDNFKMNKKRNYKLGLTNHTYFNAGVLVIDVKKWNQLNLSNKILNIIDYYKDIIKYEDQDALNILLSKKVKYISKIFNCINVNEINVDDIILLHFANHPKPWNKYWKYNVMYNSFTKHLYNNYEQYTEWKNMPLENLKLKSKIKCLLKYLILVKIRG